MPDDLQTPAAVAPPVPPPHPMAAPFVAFGKGAAGMGIFVAGGVVLAVLLNTVSLPAFVGAHAVALAIAAFGGVAAIRWVRKGVRQQLKASASAKVAEFGGGLYGALAFATLLYLEVIDLVGDVASAGSLGAFFRGIDFGWLMGQLMESIGFAIKAGMWPWFWFAEMGPMVAALVAGGVWALHGVLPSLWERVEDWRDERRGGVAGAEETP